MVRFGHLTDALEGQRLRSMEHREIGGATRRFRELDPAAARALLEPRCALSRIAGPRFQKLTLSRRISCIKGVRSR